MATVHFASDRARLNEHYWKMEAVKMESGENKSVLAPLYVYPRHPFGVENSKDDTCNKK